MTPLFTGRTGKAVLSSVAAISLGAGLSLAAVPAAQATPTAPPGPTAPTCWTTSPTLTACDGDELPTVGDFVIYPDGDFAVGETVSVSLGEFLTPPPGKDDVTYEWFSEDSEEPFATGREIVLPASVKGEEVFARASYAPEGYQPATAETPPITVVEYPKVAGAAVSIDDTTPVVGQTLSALPVTADDLTDDRSLTQSFQWLSKAPDEATSTPIRDATSAEYAVTPADLGKTLKVRYTVKTKGRSATTVLSPATGAVAQGTISIDEAPSFTGTARVDQTLTAVAPATTPSSDTTYQWQADTGVGGTFVDIDGATDETFTIPPTLAGQLIRLAALVSAESSREILKRPLESGYSSTTAFSEPSGPVAKGAIAGTSAFIIGTAQVGQTLAAGASTATPGTSAAYDWQVRTGGAWKSAGTTQSFTVPTSAAGQRIRLRVVFTAPGYEDSTVIADDESVVAAGSFTGSPTVVVSGTTITGRTLTAQVTAASSPAADAYSHQWLANGTVIAGADGSTLTLTPDLVGRVISVRATPIKAGYTPGTAGTSAGVGPVRAPAPVLAVSDGTIKRGQTFSVTGTDLPAGQRYSIQLSGDTVRTGVVPPSGVISRKVRFPKAATGRTRTIRLRVFDARGRVTSSLTTKVSYRY